jgi:hypothetical protein
VWAAFRAGPLANEAILLADPGPHPELVEGRPQTYLDWRLLGQTVEMSLQRAWEIF